ncbi:helix-turn-helix domain-containing protein [Flaviaesturariibacter aridisoli]|uniref:XRE family transcriptional regulator n=1 Tax=Flaviaesturariibacter aridisoli TaxID=2545761 RepID=A0A4R4E6W2_9BACT|nr:helix-turn-helix transcriptional regulator [Flaviaesturariibacter aridisoli]TCZ73458.1 XRE family transcriptional regulator [Flaviaesturariibacter aridisoli]
MPFRNKVMSDTSRWGFKRFSPEERKGIWEEVGRLLWKARVSPDDPDEGFSQAMVVKTGIISQSALSKVESGKQSIDIITMAELASLYEVELESLIPAILKEVNILIEERKENQEKG